MGNNRGTEEITVGPLLARAKLLRLRGQWDESISVCTEALRKYPDSVTAHSLLGEIYETLGRLDDAAQWYAMAVERDPKSPQEKVNLERTLMAQQALRPPVLKPSPNAAPKPATEKTLEWFDRIFPPGRTDSIARLIFAVSGILAALLLLSAAVVFFAFRQNSGRANASLIGERDILPDISAPEAVVVTPRAAPNVVARREDSAPPVMAASSPAPPSLPPAAGNAPAGAVGTTGEQEAWFKNRVASIANEISRTTGLTIKSVNRNANVATGSVIGVNVTIPVVSEEPMRTKDRVIRAAAEALCAAARADSKASYASVRIFLAASNGRPEEMAFYGGVGDASIAQVRNNDPSKLGVNELLNQFDPPIFWGHPLSGLPQWY